MRTHDIDSNQRAGCNGSAATPHRRVVRAALPWTVLALAAGLSSCGGDGYCWNCGPPQLQQPYEYSLGLVAGNFTGNGFTSVVQTSTVQYDLGNDPGNIKAYLSTGSGAFAAPVLTPAGDNPLYLASADLNGDHLPDIVSANYADNALVVFFNDGSSPGTFNPPLVLNSPGASQLAILDMNGDGMPDIVSADFNVSLFVQTAPGSFAAPIGLYSGGANWVALGDLNHDGAPDIALTDAVGVKVLFHTGAASATTYSAPVSVFTQTANANLQGANIIAIADVNGDGYLDLIITDPGPTGGAAPTVNVLLQNPASPGTFLAPVSYPVMPSSLAQSIIVADVDGDGHPDIIIGGTAGVTVLLDDFATSPGTFKAATNYPAANANEIALADVNGDGLVDIIVDSGTTNPVVNGIVTNNPGVLLQSSTTRGTFSTLQNLP